MRSRVYETARCPSICLSCIPAWPRSIDCCTINVILGTCRNIRSSPWFCATAWLSADYVGLQKSAERSFSDANSVSSLINGRTGLVYYLAYHGFNIKFFCRLTNYSYFSMVFWWEWRGTCRFCTTFTAMHLRCSQSVFESKITMNTEHRDFSNIFNKLPRFCRLFTVIFLQPKIWPLKMPVGYLPLFIPKYRGRGSETQSDYLVRQFDFVCITKYPNGK